MKSISLLILAVEVLLLIIIIIIYLPKHINPKSIIVRYWSWFYFYLVILSDALILAIVFSISFYHSLKGKVWQKWWKQTIKPIVPIIKGTMTIKLCDDESVRIYSFTSIIKRNIWLWRLDFHALQCDRCNSISNLLACCRHIPVTKQIKIEYLFIVLSIRLQAL